MFRPYSRQDLQRNHAMFLNATKKPFVALIKWFRSHGNPLFNVVSICNGKMYVHLNVFQISLSLTLGSAAMLCVTEPNI